MIEAPARDARASIRLGFVCGLAAAATFGLSAPAAKGLLASWSPLALAAALYLGAAAALTAARLGRALPGRPILAEAPLQWRDAPALAVIVVSGGLAGPVLMLLGLERVSGMVGALCLNLEAPLTMALSVVVFGEHLTRREALAALCIVAGATLLGVVPGEVRIHPAGILLLAAACLCWAVDNNVTQFLSGRDPLALTQVKTLSAGTLALVAAGVTGSTAPTHLPALLAAAGVGAVSYGLSILLDTYALRLIGAAREAAVFASAPLFGAVLAMPLLGDRPGPAEICAAILMTLGMAVLVRSRHEHWHAHDAIAHEHGHWHDAHHDHHPVGTPAGEVHSHPHRHDPLVHRHPHVSDAHHRHRH